MEVSNTWFQQWKTANTQPHCFGVNLASPSPAKHQWDSRYRISVMFPERIATAGPALPSTFPWYWGSQACLYCSSVSTISLLPLPRAWETRTTSQNPQTDPDRGWKGKTVGCPEECPAGSKHYQPILALLKQETPNSIWHHTGTEWRKMRVLFWHVWHPQSPPDKANTQTTNTLQAQL